jgi:type IV pilus assembly protein PilX
MKAAAFKGFKHGRASASKQSGIVMFVALAVLILMTLAGLAMLRQMSGSVSIAGNLAFKQNATSFGDRGTEAAIALVMAPGFPRDITNASIGYYSTWNRTNTDPASYFVNPSGATSAPIIDSATGNTVRYVVHRMCEVANAAADAPGQYCARSGVQVITDRGDCPCAPDDLTFFPYFQITTQISGPRNTVSYIQVVMN